VSPDQLSVGFRTLALASLFQSTGTALFLLLFGDCVPASSDWLRRLGCYSAVAAALLILVHLGLEPARMADDYAGIWNPDLLWLAATTANALSHGLQVLGLLIVALALRRSAVPSRILTLSGVLLALLAPLLTGHTSVHPQRWLLAPLLFVHLLLIAFWSGALAPLYRITQRESAADAARALRRFTALAGPSVPLIALAGLAMAMLLAPDLQVLHRHYGQLLLAKLAGFAALMLIAAYNRWSLTPAIISGDALAARRLRVSIAVEALSLLAILLLTAMLTAFYSPEL
jgi:putative copper export protein